MTLPKTIWQFKIGEEWRYCGPDSAAIAERERPGTTRQVPIPAIHGIRFSRSPRPLSPDVSPRRIRRAELALKRERERLPLFTEQVAGDQPTPQARVERMDEAASAYSQRLRDFNAAQWKQARQALRELPEDAMRYVLAMWSVSGCPGTAAYLLDFLREFRLNDRS